MPRDCETYLWEMNAAGLAILEFTATKNFEDYASDLLLRSGVERQFMILGEALAQFRLHFPTEAAKLSNLANIISFRNFLIHQYHLVDDEAVWEIVHRNLIPFLAEVTVLLDEWHQG